MTALIVELMPPMHVDAGMNTNTNTPRIPTISKDTDGTFVSFKRVQLPVLLAYTT